MFEISFGEIMIIGVVALVVLGPERLPTVARTLGALLGRAQRFVSSVKADIHQQSQMAGFDDLKRDVQDAANVFRNRIENEVNDVRQIGYQVEESVQQQVQAVSEPVKESVADVGDLIEAASLPQGKAAEAAEAPAVVSAPADEGQLDLFNAANPTPAERPSTSKTSE